MLCCFLNAESCPSLRLKSNHQQSGSLIFPKSHFVIRRIASPIIRFLISNLLLRRCATGVLSSDLLEEGIAVRLLALR